VAAVVTGTAGATPSTADQYVGGTPVSVRAPGEPLVFMVGDSVPLGLAVYFPTDTHFGFALEESTYVGCGLVPARTYVDGQVQRFLPQCLQWSASWPRDAAAAHPQVGAVFLGDGELFDQQVAGHVVRFGTSAFAAHVENWLTRSINSLRAAGASRVALVNVPCHSAIAGPIGDIINDSSRIAWLNNVVKSYVARHQPTTALIDLHGYLCASGYTNTLDGVQLRTDGVHFSKSGARVVWAWLGPQLTAVLRSKP
jgi:hypothetical protein